MPHTRTKKAGSFDGHFDELVKHFPHDTERDGERRSDSAARELQEKRDIHALLFERAWQLDREPGSGSPS
jgi:hypothetical protein